MILNLDFADQKVMNGIFLGLWSDRPYCQGLILFELTPLWGMSWADSL